MSEIRSTLTVEDKTTPILDKIINKWGALDEKLIHLENQVNKFNAEVGASSDGIQVAYRGGAIQVDKMSDSFSRLIDSAKESGQAFDTLVSNAIYDAALKVTKGDEGMASIITESMRASASNIKQDIADTASYVTDKVATIKAAYEDMKMPTLVPTESPDMMEIVPGSASTAVYDKMQEKLAETRQKIEGFASSAKASFDVFKEDLYSQYPALQKFASNAGIAFTNAKGALSTFAVDAKAKLGMLKEDFAMRFPGLMEIAQDMVIAKNGMVGAINEIRERAATGLSNVGASFKNLGASIKQLPSVAQASMQSLARSFLSAHPAIASLVSSVQSAMPTITSNIKTTASIMVSLFGTALRALPHAVNNIGYIGTQLRDKITSGLQNLPSTLSNIATNVKTSMAAGLQNLPTLVSNAAGTAFSRLRTMAANGASAVATSFRTYGPVIANSLKSSVSSAASAIPGLLRRGVSGVGTIFRTAFVTIPKTLVSAVRSIPSVLRNAFQSGANLARQALDRLPAPIQKLREQVRHLGETFKNALKSLPDAFNQVKNAVQSLGQAITTVIGGLQNLFAQADQLRRTQMNVAMYSGADTTMEDIQGQMYNAAVESNAPIQDIADLTQGISISGVFGEDTERAMKLATELTKAGQATSTSAEGTSRAMVQLQQALASGVLQGDELRSIREQAPGITQALVEGLNKMQQAGELGEEFANVTMGDLKQLGSEGLLTSDVVTRAFEQSYGTIDNMFNSMPKTFGQVANQAKTIWAQFTETITGSGTAFQTLLQGAYGKLTSLAEALNPFEEKLDESGNKVYELKENAQAFLTGLNEGLMPLVMAFQFVGNIIDSFIGKIQDGKSAIDSCTNAGRLMGTVISGAVGAIVALLAIMAVKALIAAAPFLLIVAAIAAIIAVITYVSQGMVNLSTIMITVGRIGVIAFTAIKIALIIIAETAKWLWTVLKALFTKGGELLKAIAHAIEVTFTNAWKVISSAAGWAWSKIKSGFFGALSAMASGLGDFVNAAGNLLADLLEPLAEVASFAGLSFDVSGLRGIGQGWGAGFAGMAADAGNDADDYWQDMTDAAGEVGDAWGGVGDAAGALGDAIGGATTDYVDGLVNGIGDAWTSGVEMFDKMPDYVNDAMGKMGDFKMPDFSSLGPELPDNNTGGAETPATDNATGGGSGGSGGGTKGIAKDVSDIKDNTADKEVDLSSQDIEYLKSFSAREFLVNVNTSTPTANINFGDVRESADVNQIIQIIEDLVERSMNTSLAYS